MAKKLGFIGGGHITEMLLTRLLSSGVLEAERIMVSDSNEERLRWLQERFNVSPGKDNRETFCNSDLTLICVQPKAIRLVVEDLKGIPVEGKAILTIAAGVPIEAYGAIGEGLAILRALPNPPSKVGCGIIPFSENGHVNESQRQFALEILSIMGKCIQMNEDGISIVTSLSSPAPVFLFIDTMVEAGVLCGLSRKEAVMVAHQTVLGCLRLWENAEEKSFADLIADASTPGGVSVESLYVLDRCAFRGAVKEAYLKGAEKARDLGRQKN